MVLPKCDGTGWLPPGVHEATLDEVDEIFGRFQRSDRRMSLMRKLREYIRELRSLGNVGEMIVNGSFISSKDEPEDIDVAVRIKDGHASEDDPSPMEVLLLSNPSSRKRWSVDTHVAVDGVQYDVWKRFFGKARDGKQKGVVLLRLDP